MARLDDEPVDLKLVHAPRARCGPQKPTLDNPAWLNRKKPKTGKTKKK